MAPPKAKHHLPPFLHTAIKAAADRRLPLQLGCAPRSELEESARAVLPFLLARTDRRSGRIGRPDPKRPRRFNGLTIDYDVAPGSGISESRIERLFSTFKFWGWLHYEEIETKTGPRRCSAQPIERRANGERRGRAAIRVFTPKFWQWLGLWHALQREQRDVVAAAAAVANLVNAPSGPRLIAELADALGSPDASPRPRPPP